MRLLQVKLDQLVACTVGCRGSRYDGLHAAEQLHQHDLAGHIVWQQRRGHRGRRLRALAGRQRVVPGPDGLVRPLLGAHGLRRLRLRRVVPRLRHGRLRRLRALLPGRGDPRDAGRVNAGGSRREGLLRREPGGRVQRGHRRGGHGRQGERRDVRLRRVRGRRELAVPRGAAGGGCRWEGRRRGQRRRRVDGGVQERVRGVRDGRVLLHGGARAP